MLNGHQFTNQLAINTFEWLAYQPTPLPVPQELECLPNIYPVLSDSAAGTLHWLDCHSMRRLAAQSQMKELNSEIFQFYSEILLAVLADGSLVIWGIQVFIRYRQFYFISR
jgi:hypothetical protein